MPVIEYPTSIRLPRPLKLKLQKLAKERHHPMSLMIVAVLERFVANPDLPSLPEINYDKPARRVGDDDD